MTSEHVLSILFHLSQIEMKLFVLFLGTAGSYEYRPVYRISLVIWTVLGLSWLSLVIGSIQDFVQCVVDKTEALELINGNKAKVSEDEVIVFICGIFFI